MEALSVLRTERKYPVSALTVAKIKKRLLDVLPLDENCKNSKPYLVKSIYFDSLYNRDYSEKEQGLNARKKIRLRSYGDNSTIKLEWKRKLGAKQRKLSLLVNKEEAESLLHCNYSFLLKKDNEVAESIYAILSEEVYIPRCTIVYERLAFTVPINDTRITIDSNISTHEGMFNLLDERIMTYPVQNFGAAVLEIKYNGFLLSYIKEALEEFNLVESASSKYVAGRYFGLGGIKL